MKEGFFQYRSGKGRAEAYCSNPKAGPIAGQVIVIHEVWGFTSFIRNLCGKLSRQGFRAVAPVLYWREKELFSPERVREGMEAVWHLSLEERYQLTKLESAMKRGRVSMETESMLRVLYDTRFRGVLLGDLISLAKHLRKESQDSKTGAMGFSMGGKLAMQLASRFGELGACVAYSPEPARGLTLRRISAPLLLLYGGEDRFMMHGLPIFVKEAINGRKELELRIFRLAGHEFFNSTNPAGYNKAAAEEAMDISLAFLRRNLSPASP